MDKPTLKEIAVHVPLGYECRSCGGSAYNWLMKCNRYVDSGDTCCPRFRQWVEAAESTRTEATE